MLRRRVAKPLAGRNARFSANEMALKGQQCILYSRDADGMLDQSSMEDATIHDLRFDMFGDKLVIIETVAGNTRHHILFFLANRKKFASWQFPYWFFCLPGEELLLCETRYCQPVI